ncbi:diphthine--ammonia ligase-like isoform X3 [Limulus polyphemus]|uniref:Diphthine--ammonia ligase n=1 Tax=Limulus polyphemus TaxID=6850 RepID=A0ABM1ST25_LIMPO|nr:diphthine--ammonia ligase-like isoform X3 [Limulus polyphemus]
MLRYTYSIPLKRMHGVRQSSQGGGKDSCYGMLQCVAAGHEIVALANLYPKDQDELDSYMYQTVGHQAIGLYAEAMGIPLFRKEIKGTALDQRKCYDPTEGDEVEDLHELLQLVKKEVPIEGVSVGAIMSNYQRVRALNVCDRLGLTMLAYLWQRDQEELLQEMIDCQVEAILIKVAALGLDPTNHLGKTLREIYPHMIQMKEKFGLNVCGEGGEYETFTLDCPLFKKKIVIDQKKTVIHSNDAFAPVGYLKFSAMHLVDKNRNERMTQQECLAGLPVNVKT